MSARIIDRGYQRYTGARLGPAHAVWTMLRASMERAMGIRRPFRTKILPWLLVLVVYLPVVVILALRVLFQNARNFPLPSYDQYYDGVIIPFILFAGLAAPELLCPDRRERVLSLYLSAPITRLQYVTARFAGLAILLLLLTLVPALALFVGSALLSNDAAGYAGGHLADLGHILIGGLLIALYFGAVAMAVASFSDRRAYAAGAFLGLLLVSGVAGDLVARGIHFSGHEWFILLNLLNLPVRAVHWLLGRVPVTVSGEESADVLRVSGWAYLGVTLAVTVAGLAILVWRYLEVHD